MNIGDTVWRNVIEEGYMTIKYPNEEVLVYTNVGLRFATAKDIEFIDASDWRLNGYNEKVIKFAFIGGYK